MSTDAEVPSKRVRSRRAFVRYALLGGAAATGAALPLLWRFAQRRRDSPAAAPAPTSRLAPDHKAALAAVQARLLPSEPASPGAAEIHAADYLEVALADPRTDTEDVTTVHEGLGALERRARARHGKPFVALSATEQDALLHDFEKDDDGREWIGVMVVFTLEALLSDPVYGGNHQERGWKWLGLEPPLPRPSRRWSEGT